MIKIKKGLDLPITGGPLQKIFPGNPIVTAAVVSDDFVGMKPSMQTQVGDQVKKGQLLFEDKKTLGVRFTAPVSGRIVEINRGDRRAFQSLVIEIQGNDQIQFKDFKNKAATDYSNEEVRSLLNEAGLWVCLRTRPFSKTPALDAKASSVFINVMDTNPLAPDPEVVLAEHMEDFKNGVIVISKLSPKTYVTTARKTAVNVQGLSNVIHEQFEGPHPAGNVGTHIHFLNPVSANKFVWHLNYQDVIAIGRLFKTGEYYNERVISIAGPASRNPRLVRTIKGANIKDLAQGESFDNAQIRYVSGSVLGGRIAADNKNYLGQFHLQMTMLKEGHYREFLGWHSPGLDKYSIKNVFLSKFIAGKKFNFDTNTNGSIRSIVPIGSFEAVMPLDILPTQLLRYLLVKSTDHAANLGALELDEEDLALCTFVDPCKNEYGPVLRENLNIIEKEG